MWMGEMGRSGRGISSMRGWGAGKMNYFLSYNLCFIDVSIQRILYEDSS